MTLKSYFQGNILLFDFYFKGFDKIKALPKWMRNPDVLIQVCTGKSMSEALIFASTNPQYDNRLFIELPVQYMKIPSSEHVLYINCSECQNKNKKQFVYTTCSPHVLFLFSPMF